MSLIRSTPIQLLICIVFAAIFGQSLPLFFVKSAYTISMFFIDTILFILPLIIFCYLFNALIAVDEKGPILVFVMLAAICLSNAIALCFAYFVGSAVIPHLAIHVTLPDSVQSLSPYFRLPLKHGIRADVVALIAFVYSYACVKTKKQFVASKKIIELVKHLQDWIGLFLKKAFLPLLPLYVLGFMLKMDVEGTLNFLYTKYLPVFALNVGISFAYILLLYRLVSIGYKPMGKLISTMIPAGITGFSTMSGAVTMPVTLDCTEKNIEHPAVARMVIPTTSNMHMLGDDITITLTAITLMLVNGMNIPSFFEFLPYVVGFCVAKLACVGIAGASLLVVLPVLEKHLGFSAEMVSLIITLYVLHDPFGTFHNVMGNGAFAIGLERIFEKLGLLKKSNLD